MIKNNKGFTLIELLVVISIIGMLSGIVLSALNSARARSRDSARLTTVDQINKALELYATGGTFVLPSTGGNYACLGLATDTTPICGGLLSGNPLVATANTALQNNLSGKVIPRDPKFLNGIGTAYLYNSNVMPVTTPASTVAAYLSWVMENATTCGRGVKLTGAQPANGTRCFLRVGNAI